MLPLPFLMLLLMWTCPCGARRPNKEIIEGVTFRTPGINVNKLFDLYLALKQF